MLAAIDTESQTEFDELFRTSAGLIAASLDQGRVLAMVLREDGLAVPAYAVGRSLLESASRAAWLLEGGIDDLERYRRAANEAIFGLAEMATFINNAERDARRHLGLSAGGGEDLASKETEDAYRAWGQTHGFAVGKSKIDRRGPDYILDAEQIGRPSSMQLIDSLAQRSGSESFAGYGRATYRVASAVAHGAWHALGVLGHDPSDDASSAFDSPPTGSAALVVTTALEGLAYVSECVWSFFGPTSSDALDATAQLKALAAEVGTLTTEGERTRPRSTNPRRPEC